MFSYRAKRHVVTRGGVLLALLGGVVLGVPGCRADKATSASAASSGAATVGSSSARALPSAGAVAGAPTEPTSAAGPTASSAAELRLKPILAKPFPEGASDAVVCEAISNTKEKDLWSRFGHIVPLYIRGALLVLEATEKDLERVEHYIEKVYLYPRAIQHAACTAGGMLVYIRGMPDLSESNGFVFGRRHLTEELDKKLGIKTRESFQLKYDNVRLAEYCRVDAEACDALLKLDTANEGEGLCSWALAECNISAEAANYSSYLSKCRVLSKDRLACLRHSASVDEDQSCGRRVRDALCP